MAVTSLRTSLLRSGVGLFALGLWLAGCGEPRMASPGDGGGGDGGSCDEPGVTCDVELEPPAVGIQLAVGPFDVPQGGDRLMCFWRKAPEDLDITKWEVKYNVGSHHLDIYTTEYEMPDGEFDCSNASEWAAWPSQMGLGRLREGSPWPLKLVGFQNETVTWNLPEGVVYRIRKGTQLLIQSHYSNNITQRTPTLRARAFINMHTATGSEHVAQTLFDEDDHLVLPARTTTVMTRYCYFPEEVNLIASFGHFHSRGMSHEIYLWDPETRQVVDETPIYENTNWSDPPWTTEDDGWNNGVRGPLPARGVMMKATYKNDEDREISWGFFVDENEHFETQLVFYPALDLDARCWCGRLVNGEPHLPEGRSMAFTEYPGLTCPEEPWFDGLPP